MERSTCLTSAADRELQRRSFMLTKLIEQNRVMAKQQQQQQQQQKQKQKQSASSRNADDRAALRIDIPKVGPHIHASDGGAMPRMAFRAPQPEKLPLPPTFQTKTKKTVRLADEDEDDDDDDFGHLQSLREEVRRISREKEVNDTKGGKQVVLQRSFSSPGAAAATRRRTDLSTEAEVSIAALSVVLNVRVKAADMPAAMQERAFRCARKCFDSMETLNNKRVALSLKKEFDASYGPAWHCIVGTSFGSFVTHSLGGFLYFSIDKVSVLLFKTAVEPMDQ